MIDVLCKHERRISPAMHWATRSARSESGEVSHRTIPATNRSDMLTVGQMAEMNCVSIKTLHLYHRRGLLEPCYVDPASGYRYYSIGQCPTLDAITRMKILGFSLEAIKALLESKDPDRIEEAIEGKVKELEAQICDLRNAGALARKTLSALKMKQTALKIDAFELVEMPERRAIAFPVTPVVPNDPYSLQWTRAVQEVKQALIGESLPLSLYGEVSGVIAYDDLVRGSLITRTACILLDEWASPEMKSRANLVFPAGLYLTTVFDGVLDEKGESAEYPCILGMLKYAHEHNLKVVGDYIGETIGTTAMFGFSATDALMRCNLPVRYRGGEKGGCS